MIAKNDEINSAGAVAPAAQRTALQGIRVADFTQFEAGTSCTQMLAWLGAEVIKIEPPVRGEQGRNASKDRPDQDSYYFLMLNCNKRSVTADVKTKEGIDLVKRLVAKSDVFVENYRPGVIERLGLGYDVVSRINPGLVYAQIKGFAPDGPYAEFLAFDMIAQAMGGVMSCTGEVGRVPVRAGVTVGDTGTALHCVIGILAALYQRTATGMGQRVEVAMQDAVLNFGRIAFARQLISGGKPAPRIGNRGILGSSAPSGVYACKGNGENDYCFVYTSRASNHQWVALLNVIGREDLVADERFATPESRFEFQDEIDAMIEDWTSRFDKMTVMNTLGSAGVPVGAILDTAEISRDPALRKRGSMVTVKHPVRGEFLTPGFPVKLSASAVDVVAPPLLGADNRDVYGRVLGVSEPELARLQGAGVI
jgi:formyl-CoA transferase